MNQVNIASFNSRYFTSDLPDVTVTMSAGAVKVEFTVRYGSDGDIYYQETLWPTGNVVTLMELGTLLEPFARQRLELPLRITARQLDNNDGVVQTQVATPYVYYSLADVGVNADTFYDHCFLTLLDGPKVTARGRLEYLHYYGADSASCTARYTDGTTATFTPQVVAGSSVYTTIDVSPWRFETENKTLAGYTINAGLRSQDFVMDFEEPDCAPILIFDNSFGVQELIYCTGTHKVDPSYERKQVRLGRLLKNYLLRETRTFHASTGTLTPEMANWADDLFRSQEVRVVNIIGGVAQVGKQVTITDSKSENSNDDDFMPSFTFSYQYAQRIHNILQPERSGRIFDNTFDETFN
jgi:hypothetical protein